MSGSGGLDDLKKESSFGDREDQQDPYKKDAGASEKATSSVDPIDQMIQCLEDVREGGRTPSIGCRDDVFAAYLDYLTEDPEQMEHVGRILIEHLEETDGVRASNVDLNDKAGILRLMIRVAVTTAIPDQAELIADANAEYARRNV